MISVAKRRAVQSVSVWPGYVDALSALLMVVIFVLLIFVIAYFLLSEILSGQESELAVLHKRLNELTRSLGLEQAKSEQLANEMTKLSGIVSFLTEEKQKLSSRVAQLSEESFTKDEDLKNKLLLITSLQEDIHSLRLARQELEQRVGQLSYLLEAKETQIGALRDRSKGLETRLADEKERTLLAQKEIDRKDIRIQALSALIGDQKSALEEQQRLSADARAEVALLNRQIMSLRLQLEEISRALQIAEVEKKDQKIKMEDLGRRLNIALARQVNQLEQYRSEFFGRLREILGNKPNMRIEGDRFVVQAELLFDSGSAKLGEEGKGHLMKLATTLLLLSKTIPQDIKWVLRIDGHTDRVPIHNERFASNWDLSTARAVSVVRFLADQGIPENRMLAAGFSKFHPLDPADTPEAYRKNRRIEIKLTSR
ncbi:MAG: peptidoglycan -binding protein [Deltaproteobacteria bacterium]|nr:peptidoglycan -binding protein [Deltaproteobacteria bacterium]